MDLLVGFKLAVVLKPQCASESAGSLVKPLLLGRAPEPVGLGCYLRFCILIKFLADAEAVVPKIAF